MARGRKADRRDSWDGDDSHDLKAPPRIWAYLRPLLPYLATLALFFLGLWALYHLLRPVSLDDIRAEALATPPWNLIGAFAATFAGYAAMVCYDWTALRYIGRHLPARIVALGGYLGYAVGNTVGLSPLSGGAVRYRVYSTLGLGLGDIARISTFVAVAYGVGATVIGLVALIAYPDALTAVLPLSPTAARIGSAAILVVGNWVFWRASLRGGGLRLGRYFVAMPRPGLMLTQLAVAMVDSIMGALVVYLLLADTGIPFVPFVAVYLAAMMAGILSHVPGGVGVFETVIIAALPASVPVADAAAALLMYRLIYYLVPFLVALALLAGVEGRNLATGRVTGVALGLTAGLVPLAMGAMVMASGVLMIVAPIIPTASHLARGARAALPLVFSQSGALLSIALGAMLVLIAQGLLRRLAGAWWLTMAALLGGIGASILDGFDTRRALVLGVAFLLLLPCRQIFFRPTRLTVRALSANWLLLVGIMLASVLAVLFLAVRIGPLADDTLRQLLGASEVPRGLQIALAAGAVLALLTIWYALRRGPIQAGVRPGPALTAQIRAIIARWGRADDWLVLDAKRRFLLSDGGDAFIAYAHQGRSWIALGDPVGDPDQIPGLIWAFRDAARRARVASVFYAASSRWFAQWIETGMTSYRLGEEATIDLTGFAGGNTGQPSPLRARHAHGLRAGLQFEFLPAGASDDLLAGLQAVSDAWLAPQHGRERAFSLSQFRPGWLRRFPLAVVRDQGRIVGFALIMTDGQGRTAAMDLMRYVPDLSLPVAEFLLVEVMQALSIQGYHALGLGVVPDAGADDSRGLARRLGALIYRHGGRFYGVQDLQRYIPDLAPLWQPRYLIMPRLSNPASVASDVTRLIAAPMPPAPEHSLTDG